MATMNGANVAPDKPSFSMDSRNNNELSLIEASKHAQALYDGGAPLFTKSSLRYCADQLDAFCNGQDVKFTTTGMDGVDIEASTMMSWPNPFSGSNDTKYVPCRPKLRYHPIQSLTTWRRTNGPKTKNAYVTVEVSFPMEEIHASNLISIINPPVHSGETLQRVLQKARAWETSRYFQTIRRILTSKVVPADLNKIVAFGFGSLTVKGGLNDTPIHQHILMLLLRDIVFPKNELACVAQDPDYTDADKQALASNDVVIVDDPRAFLEVDERSIVLSFSPNAPVKQVVADISRPGIIIWMHGSAESAHPSTDPESPRVDKMIREGYERVYLTSDKHFGPLEVLIRRPVTQ